MPGSVIAVQTPTVKVAGAVLAAATMDDLVDLRVARSVHAASRAELRFEDATFRLLDGDTFAVGGSLEVSLPTAANSAVKVFDGDIVSIGVDQGIGGRHELLVVALDKAHRLSGTTNQRTFLDGTIGDAVTKIAKAHGLRADYNGPTDVHPYLLQTGTDHAFLWELAAMCGAEWFVDGTSLVFRTRRATDGATLTWGDTLLRFQARYSAADAAITGVTVNGWDPKQGKAVTGAASGVAKPAGHDLGSDAPLATRAHGGATDAFGSAVVVGTPAATTAKEAEAMASALARELLGDAVTARGEALGNPDVVPGTMVAVANMGTTLSGRYYVTEVEHVFGVRRNLRTRFRVSGHRPTGLVDGRSLATTRGEALGWGRTGIVVAVVTNLKDPEKRGRVKVTFPTLGAKVESAWARLAAPGAGNERGMWWLPEVNDEVVVAFDRGDLRNPVVLGAMWNAANPPPADDAVAGDGKVVKRVIRSRLGHVIEVADGSGDADQYIELKLADGTTRLRLGKDRIDLEIGSKPLSISSGDASVELSKSGDVTISGTNVTIKGSAKVAVSAPTVELKASGQMKVESSGTAEVKGATVKLEGSAMAEVKGAMVKIN